jgi:hypothetical protein
MGTTDPDESVTPITATTHVLWARSERYKMPFVVSAWSAAFRDAFPEMFWEEVHQAQAFITDEHDVSDGPWEFTIVVRDMPAPAYPWEARDA